MKILSQETLLHGSMVRRTERMRVRRLVQMTRQELEREMPGERDRLRAAMERLCAAISQKAERKIPLKKLKDVNRRAIQ
jgi:hypothetical protein